MEKVWVQGFRLVLGVLGSGYRFGKIIRVWELGVYKFRVSGFRFRVGAFGSRSGVPVNKVPEPTSQ